MKTLTRSICQIAWLFVVTAAQAQDAALEAKQRELVTKMMDVNRQMQEIRQSIGRAPEFTEVRKAMEQAQRAMANRVASDSKLVEARKAADEAQKKAREIAGMESTNDKEAAELLAQIKARSEAMNDLMAKQQEAQVALMNIRRQLSQGPDLRGAADEVARAIAGISEAAKADPKVAEAAKRMAEARKALEEKVQAMPEKKAVDEAERAYFQAMQASPEADAARQKRDEAMKAFDELVQPKLAADPEGAAQLKRVEESQQKLREAQGTLGALQGKLQMAFRRLSQANPKIAEGFKGAEEAEAAFRDAIAQRANAEKADVEEAQRAFSEKIEQRAGSDPRMAELQKQLDALREQMQELRQ